MKECCLYKKLPQNKAQCRACCHYCLVEAGKRGKCGVRENQNGKLYSLVYGRPAALAIDPIEKKPLYHFLPQSKTLSIAAVGCNFACRSCQNWTISQGPKLEPDSLFFAPELSLQNKQVSPQKIVDLAFKYKTPSVSYTYTEPTVFLDYAFDIMKLANKKGLKNIWVSNGFMSPQTLDLILPYLDAVNIDLKGFTEHFYQKYCGARLWPVLNNLKALFKTKTHLEITTLVIPSLNDQDEIFENIAKFIKKELSPDIPWHISAFSPEISWKLQNLYPTSLKTLQKAKSIGQKHGLKNIHLGNVNNPLMKTSP